MLRIPLRPSRYLAVVLTGAHIGAAATLLPLDIPGRAAAATIALVVASLVHTLRRHAFLRSASSFVGIEIREHDSAVVQTRDGAWHHARVLPTTFVSPLLTVLNLRVSGRLFARHVVLARDSARAEDLRKLRVWLRWAYRCEPPS